MKMRLVMLLSLMTLASKSTLASSPFLQALTQETDPQKQINLFLSTFPDPATTYPTLHQVDDAVNLVYQQTLGLPESLMSSLRRFYAYLKQTAVNEYLSNVPVQQGTKQTSLLVALSNATEQLEIAHQYNDTEAIATWTTRLAQLTAQKQRVVATLGPQIIDLCRKTDAWQNHLKIFLTNSFSYELQLLGNINQDEIKMFTYIPQFENAYYSTIYTTLRHDAEYVRIFLVMTDILRQRVLPFCTDWKNLTDPAALYDAIELFKKSDFYLFAKQFETISNQSAVTPLVHFTPLSATATKPASVPAGYAQYLKYTQTPGQEPTLTAALGMAPLFSIQNNVPSLTAFGTFLLTEGLITPVAGTPYYGLTRTTNFTKLFVENENGTGHLPTPLFMELLSFTAINLLNQNNSYLFNQANLADTMQRLDQLRAINNPVLTTFPNLIFYQPEDQLLLEDINTLTATVITPTTVGAAAPANFFSDLWDDFMDLIHRLEHILKQGFEDLGGTLWHDIKSIGNFVVGLAQTAENLYYETGLSCFVNGVVYGDPGDFLEGFKKAGEFAENLPNTAVSAIGSAINDCMGVVNAVADVAQQVVDISASVVGSVVGAMDSQLGDDLTGLLESAAGFLIDSERDMTDLYIAATGDLVKLSAEAIALASNVIVGTITAVATGGNVGDVIGDATNSFVEGVVTSILSCVSLAANIATDALKNIMVGIGYLTAVLTDLTTDVAEEVAAFGVFMVTMSPSAAEAEAASVRTTMNEHRRLISAIVGTVLMIAVTVATLGAAGPLAATFMVAMTVGMMVPDMIGANQQDMDAMSQIASQEAFLASFGTYVQQCQPAQTALQQSLLQETGIRLQEQTMNADRGLVYYQNYLNGSLNATRALQAYQLSSFYSTLTTPDTTTYPPAGILPADPGYSYGIQTGRMDLNPSQGLRVYNAQRGSFAQEIATIPAPLSTTEQLTNSFNSSSPTSSLSQHFITQKDLGNFTTSNRTVTVRWRVIYESQGDFYVGIYLNKNYIDTQFLNFLNNNFETVVQNGGSNQQAFNAAWTPLQTFNRYLYAFDTLAQAFVCYRNSDTGFNPALGVYQHLGKGFISANNQPSETGWYQRGTWYTMTATATDDQLQVSFSQENNPAIHWSTTVPIQPLTAQDLIPYEQSATPGKPGLMAQVAYHPTNTFTGSFGMITSGAAVEYEFVKPEQMITQSSQRQASNVAVSNTLKSIGSPTQELQREQAWIQALEKNLNPSFAGWKLVPFSDLTIAQGTYAYTTLSTNLGLKNSLTDVVVSLANPPGESALQGVGMPLVGSSARLGQPVTNAPFMLSLVTGNCYNSQGQITLAYPDALAAYKQQIPTAPSQLIDLATKAAQAFVAREVGPFTFQNATVAGILATAKKDVYIYTCPSFTQYLSGLDYLVFVYAPTNGTPGTSQPLAPLTPKNDINCALSLVTGIAFNLTTEQQTLSQLPESVSAWHTIQLTPSGTLRPQTLQTYQPFIDAKTYALIQSQASAYHAAQTAAQQALIAAQEQAAQAVVLPAPPPLPPLVPSLANLNMLMIQSAAGSGGAGLSLAG